MPVLLAVWGVARELTAQSIAFSNLGTPFYAVDGITPLAGNSYAAALYVGGEGAVAEELLQIGPARSFVIGGLWLATEQPVPFPPDSIVTVQVRFWETLAGTHNTFEEAQLAGASIGATPLLPVRLGGVGSVVSIGGLESTSLVPTLTLTRGLPGLWVDTSTAIANGETLEETCGVTVGTARWFRCFSPVAGEAVLTTEGSEIDTVMAVYTGSIISVASLMEITCNDDRSANDTASEVRFPVAADVLYLVSIAGEGGATGSVRLSYSLSTLLLARRVRTGRIELAWPEEAVRFRLERRLGLGPPHTWQAVTQTPSVTLGWRTLQMEATGRDEYYRLRMDLAP